MSNLGISILVPTRKRPESIERFSRAVNETAYAPKKVEIVFGVDADDEVSPSKIEEMQGLLDIKICHKKLEPFNGGCINLSYYWNQCYEVAKYPIVGFFGDDVLFRTVGWDTIVRDEFSKDPFILLASNDVHDWRGKLAVLFFTHKKVHEALGFYMDDQYKRNFMDYFTDRIFRNAGKFVYRDDLVTEHLRIDEDETCLRAKHLKEADNKIRLSPEAKLKMEDCSQIIRRLSA